MPSYRVLAHATVEIVTEVEADSEDEAIAEAGGKDVEICIHGSEFAGGHIDGDFKLVDGQVLEYIIQEAEEV